MFSPKEYTFGLTLERRNNRTPWGCTIVGGADLGVPITVVKVASASPCDGRLLCGDEIIKIGNYDARDLTYAAVQDFFQRGNTAIKLYIKRKPNALGNHYSSPPSAYDNPSYSASYKNVSFSPADSYDNYTEMIYGVPGYFAAQERDEHVPENADSQPYRTTPLVLPGAKAKHEAPIGSYLRHHPNPMVRSGPSHYELLPQPVAMKQKVADTILEKIERDEALSGKQIVRQQFNTPIGLYSNKNIVDTIHNTSIFKPALSKNHPFGQANFSSGPRKAVAFNPATSETYKALQEEEYGNAPVQEVTVPPQTKIFTPNKSAQVHQPLNSNTYNPSTHSGMPNVHHNVPYVNSMGHSGEQIAQSGSFKRLMNMVLADSDY